MGVIMVIGITGGPSSGKTSCKRIVCEYIMRVGKIPIFIPEAATFLGECGIQPTGNLLDAVAFQTLLGFIQLGHEQTIKDAFRNFEKDVVLILDRTLNDGRVYLTDEQWQQVLRNIGRTQMEVFQGIDQVIHMLTAAEGAEKFYTCENNATRTETAEMARMVDQKTREAYYGFHKPICYIGNDVDFQAKLIRTANTVLSFLGEAETVFGKQKKFLVEKVSQESLKNLGATERFKLEQTYLTHSNQDFERRIRKVHAFGENSYYYTEKNPKREVVLGKDHPISKKEYDLYLGEKLTGSSTIEKNRQYFSANGLYYQYDEFPQWKTTGILEIQLTHGNHEYHIPSCFQVKKDITDEYLLYNKSLAMNFRPMGIVI